MQQPKMIPVIKFTGDYEALLTKGFTFQKMYAAEYPCYHDYSPEREGQHCLSIWQNEQRVEIDQHGRFSATILQYLEGKTFKRGIAHIGVNKETKELFEVTRDNDADVLHRKCKDNSSDELWMQADEYYLAWFKTYSLYHIDVDQLHASLKRIDGMYEIIQEAL
jgi:hypothetical protein